MEEESSWVPIEGRVTSGVERGKNFLSLRKYREQFKEKMDISPYEGTLNVKLRGENLKIFQKLKEKEGVLIEGFEKNGKRYGKVNAFYAELGGIDCAVIIPEFSRYEETMEVISEKHLREELGLHDEDLVQVLVKVEG